jgi:hypothetical protein
MGKQTSPTEVTYSWAITPATVSLRAPGDHSAYKSLSNRIEEG